MLFRSDAGSRYRYADLTLRIPVEKLAEFTAAVNSLSNVVSSSRNTEDVTLQYVDTESRVKTLETERDRLLELMEQAETMSDLLEIESRLTEVRGELERYASQLKVLDLEPEVMDAGIFLVESLNQNGWLDEPLADLAADFGCSLEVMERALEAEIGRASCRERV